MNTFTLRLQDGTRSQQIEDVVSFVGEDQSGSFGILAGHSRFIACLVIGLARFRVEGADWTYLALPGAVLYFRDNMLTLSTRHYLMDDDYTRVSDALQEQLLAEEEKLHAVKESIQHMEEAILKRLWELGRSQAG